MAIDGTYNVTIHTPRGPRVGTVELAAAGVVLSGTINMSDPDGGNKGERSFSDGKVEGDSLEFVVTANGPMGPMDLTWRVKVDGDTMSGKVELGRFGEGIVEGKRV